MKSFWDDINKTYDLTIGDKELSPILRCSAGLSLKYISEVKSGKIEDPLCLCFPEKFESAMWLSLSVLRNFFLEDYIFQNNARFAELNLRKGVDNVEVHNCIARYLGHDDKTILLGFKDAQTKRSISLISQINKTELKKLSKIDQFKVQRRALKANRNAISKIIEPRENTLINTGLLDSKVILVTGRGNLSKVKKTLYDVSIYDEPIGRAFGLYTNLLVTPDLEQFKNQFDSQHQIKSDTFKKFFLASYEQLKSTHSEQTYFDKFKQLQELVENDEFHTTKFKDLYDSFLDEIDPEELPQLFNISERYPGITEPLPAKIQAVVLNDISLFDPYYGTISGLIKKRIPVIIVCDKSISFDEDVNYFSDFFKKYHGIRRLDWTKSKIEALATFDGSEKYLDQNLWIKCKRYSRQKIQIEKFSAHPLDPILLRLQNLLVSLEGFERLKEAYWNFFYPAAYAIKNDPLPNAEIISGLINRFTHDIRDLKTYLNQEANDLLALALITIKNNISNTKKFEIDETVFIQSLKSFENVRFSIPSVSPTRAVSKIDDNLEQITFPGFPLNEPINSVLIKSIHLQLVPLVRILAWPEESLLIFQYIYRRLRGGYCTDSGITQFGFPQELLLETLDSIRADLSKTLPYSPQGQYSEAKQEKAEDSLLSLSRTRINGYSSIGKSGIYSVKCNIVHLDDEWFMFLPHSSKVLAETETSDGSLKIKRVLFPELRVGYKVFSYKLDKSERRETMKETLGSLTILEDLYSWKSKLNIIVTATNGDVDLIEKRLNDVKIRYNLSGNPSKQNILRWLYDDELLSPSEDNLKIILAASSPGDNDAHLRMIRKAYRKVNAWNIHVASQIKNQIMTELKNIKSEGSENFFIDLGKLKIEIVSRNITSIQKDDFEVDYNHTRKFIH